MRHHKKRCWNQSLQPKQACILKSYGNSGYRRCSICKIIYFLFETMDAYCKVEHFKQEIKLEPKEEISSGDVKDEESDDTHHLKTENIYNETPKTEDIIKTEDGQLVPFALTDRVNGAEESIAKADPLKFELLGNDFKNEMIKPEVLKTLVIKLERVDDKCFVDGLKVCKEEYSCNNKNITYTFPMKAPKEVSISITVDNTDEESDRDSNSVELNLDTVVDPQVSLPNSTSANIKKKYTKPLKFACTFCNKRCPSISSLNDHTRMHTGERPYCCSYCENTFRTKTVLKLHLQIHTGKRHECSECNMRFTQVGPLKTHLLTHSGDRPFQCSKCRRGFISKPILMKHFKSKCFSSRFKVNSFSSNSERKHNNDQCYTCDICNKNFKRKVCLSGHIKIVHLKKETFPCRICGMLSFTRGNQRKHERLHESKFDFVCLKCNMRFKDKGSLTCHMKSTHSESKPFSCDQCNASFKIRGNLKAHNIVRHAKKNPNKYICDVCNAGFYHLTYLKRHQKSHTGADKIHTCNDCGLKCRSKTDMERHVVTHIGGGEKAFKCDFCAMAFSRSNKLLRHQLVHSDEKPYRCDLCTKAYKDASSLRIHKGATHLKIKFTCAECGFKSNNESSFKRHVRLKVCKHKITALVKDAF